MKCRYCGSWVRDEKGRFVSGGTVCVFHADLPKLEPLEPESAWIRMIRASREDLPEVKAAA